MTKKAQTKDDVRTGSGSDKVYCITCGRPIGRAVPGNMNAGYCGICRNEYTLDLRETADSLKNSAYQLTLKL